MAEDGTDCCRFSFHQKSDVTCCICGGACSHVVNDYTDDNYDVEIEEVSVLQLVCTISTVMIAASQLSLPYCKCCLLSDLQEDWTDDIENSAYKSLNGNFDEDRRESLITAI